MIFKKKDIKHEFLPAALEIIEKPESPLGKVIIWMITILFIITITWSIFGKIDEVAVAQGKVIPDGDIKVIQSLEGGVITAIHVQEGERVKAGQLLIELDTTINKAELDKVKISLQTARVERALLQATHEGNIAKVDQLIKENAHLNIDPEILVRQTQLKNAKQANFASKEESLKTAVEQSVQELEMAKKQVSQTETRIKILEEQVKTQQTLIDGGAAPTQDLLDKQNELDLMRQQRESQLAQIGYYEAQVRNKEQDINLNSTEYQQGIMEELVEKDKVILELGKEVEKMDKRLSLQTVIAPVDGVVQGVGANTIGGIVSSEKAIVTIVPDNTPLLVEAMVLNKDIGFVKMGQKVDIKLDTFPFQKYGSIEGEIIQISPDAIEDEKRGYVYKIKIKPKKYTIKIDNNEQSMSPGMTAMAEVKTGKRRVIEFFVPGIEQIKDGFEIR